VHSLQEPAGVTYSSHMKSELAGPHRLMSSPDACVSLRMYLSICGNIEHFIFIRRIYSFM